MQVLKTLNWLVLVDIFSNWSVKTCLELDFSYRLVSRQLIVYNFDIDVYFDRYMHIII